MDKYVVFGTLLIALVLFATGRLRYDVVALLCLLIVVVLGAVPASDAFSGFAHPAVVTVAMVLIVSRGIQNSGIVDIIGRMVLRFGFGQAVTILVISLVVCVASAFMNNVGALAVMMPLAIVIAHKNNFPPSRILMPIAFASLLGGTITVVGTPPNIIISSFRENEMGIGYAMFDFASVGLTISVIGITFIATLGWKLLPLRKGAGSAARIFNIEAYTTEVKVTDNSRLINRTVGEISKVTSVDVQVLQLVRDNHVLYSPDPNLLITENDILAVNVDSTSLRDFLEDTGATLVGKESVIKDAVGVTISSLETVVMTDSILIGSTASSLQLRTRYGVNLIALSRKGYEVRKRLDHVRFRGGDVLLLQADESRIEDVLRELGCLPLARRDFFVEKRRSMALTLGIFIGAIVLIVTNVVPVQIGFALAAVTMTLFGLVTLRNLYRVVDWSIIVLLGAMLPLGTALETSGGADMIASFILSVSPSFPIWLTLMFLFITTMLLSNIINNAATAVLMAPIGIAIAHGLNVSADPFLMTVAVAASAAFLTPIGHQSNTLVMGPGGYHFTDYTRMGLPLSVLLCIVSVPVILFFWPLG